jgi:ATP:corrinoid adenosyltransferase
MASQKLASTQVEHKDRRRLDESLKLNQAVKLADWHFRWSEIFLSYRHCVSSLFVLDELVYANSYDLVLTHEVVSAYQ